MEKQNPDWLLDKNLFLQRKITACLDLLKISADVRERHGEDVTHMRDFIAQTKKELAT